MADNLDFSELGSGFEGDSLNYNPLKDVHILDTTAFEGDTAYLPNFKFQDAIFDPVAFEAFAKEYPEDAALLKGLMGGDYGFAPVGADNPPTTGAEGAGFPGEGIKSGVKEWDDAAKKAGVELTDPNAKTGLAKILDDIKKGVKDITGVDAGDLAKYGLLAGIAKMAYDDAAKARKEARGVTATGGYAEQVTRTPSGSKKLKKVAMGGGIGSLEMARGGRTLPPRYLDGHSDGMEDKIPANIDGRQPAALSDGEFVIPADVVSHLGNGNSNAGAKRLYEMMDRIRTARTGNHKQGKQINPDKFMPR